MATGVGPPAGNRCRQEDENYDGRGHPPNPPIRPARPSVKPHDGGYDCEFVKRPASDLWQAHCPVCLLVLREPQQVTCCGYSYCQNCIQKIKGDGKPCPTCSKEFDTFPNKRLKRTLYVLRVYCVQRRLGCEWEGELGELDRHLNLQPPPEKLLEGCQFSEVECTLCLQPFQRHYLQAHQSDDCPKRPFACQHCNQHEATFEEVTQSHWSVCPSFPLTCPNNCDLVLQRQELEQHVRYDCLLTPVYCDFYMSGCGEVLPRRDMPSHITTNIAGHLSLLEEHMRTHPAGVNNVACMVLMLGTIQKMATENSYTRSQLQETNKQLQKPHVKITESHDQLCKLKESHDQLRESYDQLLESHEHSRESHDKLYKSHYQLRESYDQLLESHEHSRESHDIQNKSHVKVCESYEWLRASYDQLHESHDKLRESHDQCRNDLSSAQDRVAQLEETVIPQNEEYQRRMEENHQLANKMEKSQEKMAQLERAMTTHTIRCEKQERRIDAAMTQSHEMVTQQVSGLQVQESLAQQKDELTMMMKASEEKLDKSLATTETKFQTLLATFEAKLQRPLVNSEEKLQASLAKQQTMITEFSNDSRRLSQTINEQERKHGQKVADLQKVIDKKKSESMEKMRAMENQLQTSLATQKATILAKYRSLEACEEQLRASLAAQQTKCSDENRQLRQAITKQERKQSETETKMEKLVDEKKSELTKKIRAIENNLQTSLATQQTTILAKCSDENRQLRQAISKQKKKQQENEATVMSLKDDFSHKIAASEQNIRDQEATLTLHQQTLKRVTCTGELPFDFTMTEFKSKKKNDVDWYSPPFYTHTHGYRMCIRVNANGNGDEKGTHLSVLAYLMQGPYDDDLMWPFQGVITIQLLNQLEDGNHHTHTINFTGTTDPTIINKVTCGERAGSAWGTHTSLSHTQLDLNSKGNCQYLKDDQLKFRVSKATNLDLTSHIHRQCLKLESFARAIEPQVAVAPIEFTLSDFEQQKNHNSVWISPAFYTHHQGYRICLQVHPNGNIDGQGTHVSIYTCLMRGPFDGGLKWPFQGDVTIQIVDQAGEKNHEDAIHYNHNTHDSCANRVTEGERSFGWGYNKFLSHTFLGYNTATNTQYLRANSLRIRITKVEIKNNNQKEATFKEFTQSHVSVCPSISHPISEQERKQQENEATAISMVLKDNFSQKKVAKTTPIFEKQERTYENIDFNYTGREHHLHLEKYGIKMHFPCHTSSPSVSSQLSIRGTVSVLSMDYDDYVLPEGSELVSTVYNISAEQLFPEPVTVKIQHCVPLRSDDDVSQLEMGFIIADEQHGPPYKFRDLDGGEFKRGSSYGKIQCSHFSNIAIRIKWKLGHPITLFAAAFYLKYNRVCFVVTKHLSTHISDVKEEFKNSLEDLKNTFTVEICKPSEAIELDIPRDSNWIITPLIDPPKITVRSILDHQPRTSIPQITMTIEWKGDQSVTSEGNVTVNLTGVHSNGVQSFLLQCISDSPTGDCTSDTWRRKRPTINQMVLIRYHVCGEAKEFRLIEKILPQLCFAMSLLEVPEGTLPHNISPKKKCHEMLTQWLQRGSKNYPVQWDSLVQLLRDIELQEEAKELERALRQWY